MSGLDPNNLPSTVDDIDFSDLETKYSEKFLEDSLDNVVLIDNLPIVDEKKESKLIALIKKITKKLGEIKEDGIHMPKEVVDGSSFSKGYAFVEFLDASQASEVIRELNGYKLDKTHVLEVNSFMDVEKYSKASDTYIEPPHSEFVPRDHLKYWLMDEQSRDQFAMQFDQDLSVNWNNRGASVDNIVSRKGWTETYFQWSVLGTYLTTLHKQGAVLWGGSSFQKIVRFIHLGVKLVDYSPNETYFITFSPEPIDLESVDTVLGPGNEHLNPYTDVDSGNHFCVWEVRTGRLLRSFPYATNADGSPVTKFGWPSFKWSSTENFLARVTPGSKISIYEVPGMGLVGKKSLPVPNIVNFDWRPCNDPNSKNKKLQDVLAYWIPDVDNQPGRIVMISVPDMTVIKTKNIINIKDVSFHWHPSGQALCSRVQRYTRSKKSTFSSLEIFRLDDKSIPSEVVELKDNVVVFAWDPRSNVLRFAIIHVTDATPPQTNQRGMATSLVKSNVSFYQFIRTKSKLATREEFLLIKTLDKKNTTSLNWSPKGRYIILSTLRTTTAWNLEFYDTEFEVPNLPKNSVSEASILLLSASEHYGVTDLEWDPTGRYVITSASAWRHTNDNGYAIWDFKGEQLHKVSIDLFKQILWRPRPHSLLDNSIKSKIRKNIDSYSEKFDEQDRILESTASIEQLTPRRRLYNEWVSWRNSVNERVDELSHDVPNIESFNTSPSTEDEEVIEEIVEELLDEVTEFV
ncbi:Eukaryotic translation initiation factor 3 subunit B [Smittium mucronatum]|uniref:Eukaryotic translation initiation factor 3 subunit B n=1 Tax=Smittium mucronatum TaxID=133383 RepID=A0A1R0GRN3_9FUNG|nr:Eukaryotic translation initiation factor 3 subunit B [Smittium mucronatum]